MRAGTGRVDARVREDPAFRFAYAAALSARVIAEYKLLSARHGLGWGVPEPAHRSPA